MGKIITNRQHLAEIERCYNDPFFFISQMKVTSTTRGRVPFQLFPFQADLLYESLLNPYIITLKPRQMGITTLYCAYALWLCSFRPHKKVIIVSITAGSAKAFIRRMKAMYLSLPEHLKARIANGTNKQTSFGTLSHVIFANGSEIEALASTEQAGRSETADLFIMDEVAHQRMASVIWGSAQQSLAGGGRAVLISTAYGVGNFFHKYWVGATQGLNGFYPFKLNWQMHPEKTRDWYNKQRKLLGDKRTAQEIDCDFLQSGYTVFDTVKIREIEDRLSEQTPLEEHYHGNLKVYYQPEAGKQYVIGADVSTGIRGRDFSAFSIMDLQGVECACFKGKVSTNEFARMLVEWGYRYNTAILAPEVNGIGEAVIALFQEWNYPRLFYAVRKVLKLGDFEKDQSLIAGWVTTGKTRHQIITGLDEDLDDGIVELNNPFFVAEAWTFIYDENSKPIALGKGQRKNHQFEEEHDETDATYTDDAIFAVCIANEVRKNAGMAHLHFIPSAGA